MSRGPVQRPRTPDPGLPTGVGCIGNTTGVLTFSAVTMTVPRARVIAGTLRLRALLTESRTVSGLRSAPPTDVAIVWRRNIIAARLELRAKRSIGAGDLVLAALTNAPTTAV